MKRIGKWIFTMIFTFLSLFSYPINIYAATGTITISGNENFDYVKEVHQIVNEERAKEGKSALVLDKELTNRAMKRASEIAVYYSHQRANNTETKTIFDGLTYDAVGENIAVGYTTPEEVMDGWMKSEGHCANIMGYEYNGKDYSKYFTAIGIGHIKVNGTNYWVQLFSSHSTAEEDRTGSLEVTPNVEVDESFLNIESSAIANPEETINLEVPKEGTKYYNMFVNNTPVIENKGWSYAKTPFLATNFKWSSTDTSIVTINEKGQMSPKKAGTADIIAKLGDITYTYHVIVADPYHTPVDADSISLNKTSLELFIGDSEELIATFTPENTTDKSLSWTSDNPKIATVVDGVVKGVAKGKTTITVTTTNGKTATSTIIVKEKAKVEADSISLNKTTVTILEGEEDTLIATITPSNTEDKAIIWTTSNSKIATVKDGKVVGVSEGTAKITAKTNNNKTATATYIVTKKEKVTVSEINIVEDAIALTYGDERTVNLTLTPNNASDKTITWTTNNPKIAIVENGKVTATGMGVATITATTSNGLSDTMNVYVSKKLISIKNAIMNEITREVTSVTFDGLVKDDNPIMNQDYQVRGYLINGENGKRKALIKLYLENDYSNKYEFDRSFTDPITGNHYIVKSNYDDYTYQTNLSNVIYNYIDKLEIKNATLDFKDGDTPKFTGQPGEKYYDVYETWVLDDGKGTTGTSSYIYEQQFFEEYGTTLKNFEEGKTYNYSVIFKQNSNYPDYITKESWDELKNVIVNKKEYILDGGVLAGPDGIDYEVSGNVLKITIPYTIKEENVTLEKEIYDYTGSTIKPNIVVTKNEQTLKQDKDYKVTYKNNTEIGTGIVIIEGIGEYQGKVEKSFKITKEEITPTIDDISPQEYTGTVITPKVNVKVGDKLLEENKDYTLNYSNNINAGEATMTISSTKTSTYAFTTITKNFIITPKIITEKDITLEKQTIKHNGKERIVNITITMNNKTLEKDKDYKVTYSNNINIGTANITVEGINNYKGLVQKQFQIVQKDVQELSFEKEKIEKIYKDQDFTNPLTHNIGDGLITYTSSDETIATIDSTGKVTIHKTGTVEIKAVASETEEYASQKTSYKLVINKKKSEKPKEFNREIIKLEGEKLSTISLSKGQWMNSEEIIKKGSNEYKVTYTENNDSENYTTETFTIKVYGQSKVNIRTSVNGGHGTISEGIDGILENEKYTVTLTPEEGYEIDKVTINGKETKTEKNQLELQVPNYDLDIIVTYKQIIYNISINSNTGTVVELDSNKALYHSTKNITIIPEFGYKLVSIIVNGKESIKELNNNVLTLSNIEKNYVIEINSKPIEYHYIKGEHQKYIINEMNEAIFEINADYSLFKDNGIVLIDGINISNSLYTSEEGSTIIKLSKKFMNELSIGTHTIDVVFSDGGHAKTEFTVEYPEYETIPNTKTNDLSWNIMNIIGFLLSSLFVTKSIKRKTLN